AEIVEGEGKALVLEAPDEARGRGVVLDRGRLGYLEAEAGRLEGVAANLVEDYVDQGFVQEGRAGKIDGDDALRELGAPFGKGFVRGQRILDDPVIDKGHEIVALRGRYEIARARYRSVLVHEAEEDLRLGLEVDRVGKGDYRLLVEHEAALLGGLVDLRDPFHVAAALLVLGVLRVEYVDPVPALFLGEVACVVGRREHGVGVLALLRQRDDADGQGHREYRGLPREFPGFDGGLEPLR